MTIVTTFSIANQYSNVPKFETLLAFTQMSATENPTIQIQDGTPGNQCLQ